MSTAPLAGLRVLDFTRALAGPFCSMMLGDLGADVIKIEAPGSGDDSRGWGPPFEGGESAYFLSCNRNKRSVTLDLKRPGSRSVVTRLVERSDVLVENFSPGTMDRLGLSYAPAAARNPALIYCSISGFGQAGPGRARPAYDLILQGMGGLMSVTGPRGGAPQKVGVPIADLAAGMFACNAILAALHHRDRCGSGQHIDTSLLDGQLALLTFQAGRFFATGESPGPSGNEHPAIAPYETLPTADGHVNIACGNDHLFARLCQALDLEPLVSDPRFARNADRLRHRPALIEIIGGKLAARTTAEAISLLDAAGVPCGPIRGIGEALADPHVEALGMVQETEHPAAGKVRFPSPPYRFSRSPTSLRRPPPCLGEHTGEVLRELGYCDREIEAFHRERVLG